MRVAVPAAPLLDLLRNRYAADTIYTFTGDILISINPYKHIPGLYTIKTGDEVVKYADEHIPHVYAIAERSYWMMMKAVRSCVCRVGGGDVPRAAAARGP
jgi:myosin heavy subunit